MKSFKIMLNIIPFQYSFIGKNCLSLFAIIYIKCKMKVAQLCPTLSDPVNYTVHGFLQARTLEWIAVPFSRGLPNPGIEPRSPALQADSLPSELPEELCAKGNNRTF